MADEYMDVVGRLWGTWEPDAITADTESGVLIDPTKVHAANFEGRWYKTRGPLNSGPCVQGRPVIAQAGGSPRGREFAARHADTIVAHPKGPAPSDGRVWRHRALDRIRRHARLVAARMGEAMQEVGGDGYLFSLPNLSRRTLAEIEDGLVPALQRRGLARKAYSHAQFRDNLLEFCDPDRALAAHHCI